MYQLAKSHSTANLGVSETVRNGGLTEGSNSLSSVPAPHPATPLGQPTHLDSHIPQHNSCSSERGPTAPSLLPEVYSQPPVLGLNSQLPPSQPDATPLPSPGQNSPQPISSKPYSSRLEPPPTVETFSNHPGFGAARLASLDCALRQTKCTAAGADAAPTKVAAGLDSLSSGLDSPSPGLDSSQLWLDSPKHQPDSPLPSSELNFPPMDGTLAVLTPVPDSTVLPGPIPPSEKASKSIGKSSLYSNSFQFQSSGPHIHLHCLTVYGKKTFPNKCHL